MGSNFTPEQNLLCYMPHVKPVDKVKCYVKVGVLNIHDHAHACLHAYAASSYTEMNEFITFINIPNTSATHNIQRINTIKSDTYNFYNKNIFISIMV